MLRRESSVAATVGPLLGPTVSMKSDGLKRTPRQDSERLQIFKQCLLFRISQGRAELVAAIAVTGIELVATGNGATWTRRILRLGKTDLVDVVFRAERELRRALRRRLQQLRQSRHRTVVQIGCRSPDALQHARLVGALMQGAAENR